MNCKPGDLAIVVRSIKYPQDVGRIVSVRSLSEYYPRFWIVDHDPMPLTGWTWTLVADKDLRPIRDNDKEDESFRWAPSPTQKELA